MRCSLLVEKLLTMGGLLMFIGNTLIKELLARIGLLALTSGFLVKMAMGGHRLEAIGLVLPHGINCLLSVPVGTFFRMGASPM